MSATPNDPSSDIEETNETSKIYQLDNGEITNLKPYIEKQKKARDIYSVDRGLGNDYHAKRGEQCILTHSKQFIFTDIL